jgi:hypothetical protein
MRYLSGFVGKETVVRKLVLGMMLAGLGTLPQSASAQAEEAATTSEPAPEAPALQIELDTAGVDVVPSPPRTADGYTLEEMELRVRRAKIGLGSSFAALAVGGMLFGISYSQLRYGVVCTDPCQEVAWAGVVRVTGVTLMAGGFVGMLACGVMLGIRKRGRDSLRDAHYGTPRRVQWDLAQSRLVF